MKLFLDCEFNGFQGQLISMALVAEDGNSWYEVLPCEYPVEWVAKNVMPILGKKPLENAYELSLSLERFLMKFRDVHIIADWPEDIQHFCAALIVGPGSRINTPPLTMEVIRVDTESKIPHNALADAQAIRDFVINNF